FNAAGYVTGQNLEILPTESTSEDEVEIKTLHSQFQILRDKSNTFQEYKVVKVTNLNNFWNNVKDSIDVQKNNFLLAQKEIENQKAVLQKLQKEYDIKDEELQKGDYEKAHITVLGIDIAKEKYIYFNSGVIFLLLAIFIIVFLNIRGVKK
ncbi:MAG: hypothetical protein M3421_11200, partial [Bacteroidota bacterium]|nr:hypothetical protein [Bacteroidota bacterium]